MYIVTEWNQYGGTSSMSMRYMDYIGYKVF